MNDDKTFLSVDGKAATKVLSTSSPDLVQKYGDNYYGGNSTQKIFGTMLNFDSFANRFYIVDGTVYYVNAKAEANRVVKHVDSAFLSSDGKTVFYAEPCYIYHLEDIPEYRQGEWDIRDLRH